MLPGLGLLINYGDFVLGQVRTPNVDFSPNDFWPSQTAAQRSEAHMSNYRYTKSLNGWLQSMTITLQDDPFVVRMSQPRNLEISYHTRPAPAVGLDDGVPL